MSVLRESLEHRAAVAFSGYLIAFAVVCGAIIVSGWFAGVLDDPAERVFWTGAVLGFVALVVLMSAVFPGWADDHREVRRLRWTLRVGLGLAILSPVLCIAALIADFYG
jgi:hypothetical protein